MTAPVKVTREEHTPQDLRRVAASLKDAGHARRLQAISFVLDGWPRSRAAEFADVDRQMLRDWVERYNEGGVGALATFTSPGRRRMLTPNQDEELYEIVEKGPDLDRDGVVRWRRVDLVQQSAARFGVPEVHPSTMGRWLHRIGLTKLTTRPHHPKKDEAAQQAFKENFKDIANEKLPAAVKENGTPGRVLVSGRGPYRAAGYAVASLGTDRFAPGDGTGQPPCQCLPLWCDLPEPQPPVSEKLPPG